MTKQKKHFTHCNKKATVKSDSYLLFHLEIDNHGRLRIKHLDRRVDLNFKIGIFSILQSNNQAGPLVSLLS